MIKIFIALGLTIGGPAILIALSWLVGKIRYVEQSFGIDSDHDFFYRCFVGFTILLFCFFSLLLLVDMFLKVYGLL